MNAASRLEGKSKELGVSLVIGEATARALDPAMGARQIDETVLRGKTEPMKVYTLSSATE